MPGCMHFAEYISSLLQSPGVLGCKLIVIQSMSLIVFTALITRDTCVTAIFNAVTAGILIVNSFIVVAT